MKVQVKTCQLAHNKATNIFEHKILFWHFCLKLHTQVKYLNEQETQTNKTVRNFDSNRNKHLKCCFCYTFFTWWLNIGNTKSAMPTWSRYSHHVIVSMLMCVKYSYVQKRTQTFLFYYIHVLNRANWLLNIS